MGVHLKRRFGIRIDQAFLDQLRAEGVIYESSSVWVQLSSGMRWQLARGRIIITEQRFIALVGKWKIIDLPKQHSAAVQLQFDRTQQNWFTIRVVSKVELCLKYHLPANQVPILP